VQRFQLRGQSSVARIGALFHRIGDVGQENLVFQQFIAAAMIGSAEWNLEVLPFREIFEQHDFVVIHIRYRLRFLNPGINATVGSVEIDTS